MSEELQVTQSTSGKPLLKASLRDISRLASKDVDITPALSENTVDNMKAFLVVYARSQLNRVVTLTNSLNSLEDKLITQSASETDPEMLMAIIRTIQKSLDTALGLIKQVTTDESYLQVIINNTKIVQNNIGVNMTPSKESYPILANQDSRDKVRGALNTILNKLEEIGDPQVIPVESEVVSDVVPEEPPIQGT